MNYEIVEFGTCGYIHECKLSDSYDYCRKVECGYIAIHLWPWSTFLTKKHILIDQGKKIITKGTFYEPYIYQKDEE